MYRFCRVLSVIKTKKLKTDQKANFISFRKLLDRDRAHWSTNAIMVEVWVIFLCLPIQST